MPLMKPDTTVNGTNDMSDPRRSTPNKTCSNPPIMTTAKATSGLCEYSINTAAMTTVMGPVEPDIWLDVPPNSDAKKPMNMAP